MQANLSKVEALLLTGFAIALIGVSSWQYQRLQAIQLEQKKSQYAERLKTAQTVLENEMLKAAALVTTDAHTRQRARVYLEQKPQ